MGDTVNQERQNHLNMNGNEKKSGLEAEDIVADAIKLNVDEDLNEQRYDNSSEKSSNFQNGNQSLNIEDEPNYEIDENEEEEMNENNPEGQNEYDENNFENDNRQNNEKKSLANDHDLVAEKAVNNDEISKKTKNDEKDDNSTVDKKNSGKDDKNQDNSKSIENKTESSQNDQTPKKDSSKIEGNASESESKATKSKSSSSKEKDRDISADRNKSNDKIVWISGLSSTAKASDLQNLFKKYGKVVSAKIITNTKLPGSKIFGVVTMESVEIVEKCIQKLNKTEFEGKTITVEKNRLEDKKDSKEDSKKDEKSSKDKRDRSKSPRGRRSFSPIRRFPLPHHRPSFPPRRGHPPFGFRGRGGFGPRPPFMPGPPPGLIRKMEAERMFRKREIRAKERRRAEESYRRQRELERRQQEEREKLEREKLRIKIERERLEREKADFLRAEREKARLERERIEREREELRRKIQLPDSRSRSNLTPNKRFDDFVSTSANWDFDRKPRFSSSSGAPLTRYDDLDNGLDSRNNLTNFSYNLLPTTDLIDRRKLDSGLAPVSNSRDTYDMKTPSRLSDLNARSGSGSYDRGDDRRQSSNGSRRNDRDEWKRTDIRFLDKNSLTQSASQSSYLSSTARSSSYERAPDAWTSAPDRMPPASSLNKFSSYTQVSGIADRTRVQPNLTQNVVGSAIGMYQTSSMPMGGMISNQNYNNNLSGSAHRRY